MTLIFLPIKNESSLLKMSFNIKYSCHTITNIKHGRQLSLQLMTNWSLTCNYGNACLQEFKLFSKNKIYANNGGHLRIVSIIIKTLNLST